MTGLHLALGMCLAFTAVSKKFNLLLVAMSFPLSKTNAGVFLASAISLTAL